MRRQHLTSFYLEALLLLSVFVAMILVLTGVFGEARMRSAGAKRLTQAVTLAANAAEAVAGADSLEESALLLDEGGNVRIVNEGLEAVYDADGRPCPEGDGVLRLSVSWEPSAQDAALVESRIAVYAAGETEPVYTLETARFRKGGTL